MRHTRFWSQAIWPDWHIKSESGFVVALTSVVDALDSDFGQGRFSDLHRDGFVPTIDNEQLSPRRTVCENVHQPLVPLINNEAIDKWHKDKPLWQVLRNLSAILFEDLAKVCDRYFGQPQQQRNSHRVEKMPWHGGPRVNIHNDRGKAKPSQVRQVLAANEKVTGEEC